MRMFNNDDTESEQIFNGTYRPDKDVLLNCEKCSRTFHMYIEFARTKHNAGLPILCSRCRDKEV